MRSRNRQRCTRSQKVTSFLGHCKTHLCPPSDSFLPIFAPRWRMSVSSISTPLIPRSKFFYRSQAAALFPRRRARDVPDNETAKSRQSRHVGTRKSSLRLNPSKVVFSFGIAVQGSVKKKLPLESRTISLSAVRSKNGADSEDVPVCQLIGLCRWAWPC